MSEKLAVAPTRRRPIWDNECQANHTWLRVRQHADGRAIYGIYPTNFQNGQTAVAGSCSAAFVVAEATEDLNQLYRSLEAWETTHDYTPRDMQPLREHLRQTDAD